MLYRYESAHKDKHVDTIKLQMEVDAHIHRESWSLRELGSKFLVGSKSMDKEIAQQTHQTVNQINLYTDDI